jgi:hypothetical protein
MACLKVIDASNGFPVERVSITWQQSYHGYLSAKREDTLKLSTPKDGLVLLKNLHRNWSSSFIFESPGYSNAFAELTSKGKLILAEQINYFPPGQYAGEFYFTGKGAFAAISNRCFIIPLQKR